MPTKIAAPKDERFDQSAIGRAVAYQTLLTLVNTFGFHQVVIWIGAIGALEGNQVTWTRAPGP